MMYLTENFRTGGVNPVCQFSQRTHFTAVGNRKLHRRPDPRERVDTGNTGDNQSDSSPCPFIIVIGLQTADFSVKPSEIDFHCRHNRTVANFQRTDFSRFE